MIPREVLRRKLTTPTELKVIETPGLGAELGRNGLDSSKMSYHGCCSERVMISDNGEINQEGTGELMNGERFMVVQFLLGRILILIRIIVRVGE